MSNPNTLPLSIVVNVAINLSPAAAAVPTFNQALIVGPSTIIPSTSGTSPRVRQYASTAAMATDGFSSANPEFVAAGLYFNQVPGPPIVWIGRQDLTLGTPETPLVALQACRLACPNWWGCMVTSAVTSDHEAIAAWIESATPAGAYFYTTADAAVLAGTTGNVMATLQTLLYSRTMGIYATTQSGAFPNNAYAAAAIMGVAMGLNTGLANSNFTLKFKQLVGVAAEPITLTQIAAIEALNGNVYVNSANVYNWLEQGRMAGGKFLDQVLNLDMFASDMQYSMINQLIADPSIPQTNGGEMIMIGVANGVCDRAVTRGFLAPAIWNGQTVLGLTAGTPLPLGYQNQAQPFAAQSSANRAARQGMPIYSAFCEAGSMHSLTVGVYVQV